MPTQSPQNIKFTKPKLDLLKAETDGYLDYQNDTRDRAEYRQPIREATGKIFEPSRELWICKQRERDQMEKESLIEFSNHDSTGPFANTQVTLWKSPVESLSEFPIAHDYFEPENMAPAHVVPAGITPEIMDYMFSPGQASLHNHAANCLFINTMAKTSFDKGGFVIVPAPDENSRTRTTKYKILMTNPEAADARIGTEGGRLGKHDDRELHLLTGFQRA